MVEAERATVLLVCTANRCRSPLGAALLGRRAAAAGLPWTVTSAGTRARTGDSTEAEARTVLAEVGLTIPPAPARRLDVATASTAELVLTAERAHRSQVLDLVPALVGRVFTLLEFERLLAAGARSGLRAPSRTVTELAAFADASRWRAGAAGADDDLPDPIGRPLVEFRTCRDVLDRVAAQMVAAAVGGEHPTGR